MIPGAKDCDYKNGEPPLTASQIQAFKESYDTYAFVDHEHKLTRKPNGLSYIDTNFNGKKYIVTLTNARRTLLRVKELKPILNEEKKNPNIIEFPIALNYWKPRRNDPFGESVCDKLDDKQIAKTILFNLNIIKAKKEALGGDFIWNSRLIKNKDDILKPTQN
jgi:hypothetical protein